MKFGGQARAGCSSDDGHAVVEIDDDGLGIPEKDAEKVFEPFYRREPSRSRQTGGIGLGLAIVRSIARGHGGDVSLINRGGRRASRRGYSCRYRRLTTLRLCWRGIETKVKSDRNAGWGLVTAGSSGPFDTWDNMSLEHRPRRRTFRIPRAAWITWASSVLIVAAIVGWADAAQAREGPYRFGAVETRRHHPVGLGLRAACRRCRSRWTWVRRSPAR